MRWMYFVVLFFAILGIGCYFKSIYVLKDNHIILKSRSKVPRVAIVIPARNESRVIEDLLQSILAQTISIFPSDVYVIVEDQLDPTVDICHKYRMNVLFRKDLSLQRKGYALDEAMREICKKEHYDLYFILDADNILSHDFVEKMLVSYYQGYDLATGYRNCKNGNDNVIAACSALTFSMINAFSNHFKVQRGANIVISGTGFFVTGEWVEKWEGYPFHSLTEDYELSLYAIMHGMSSTYNEKAVFFDEQPISYRQTVYQRVRWIKGYFSVRKEYIPKLKTTLSTFCTNRGSILNQIIGVKPFIYLIISIFGLIIQTFLSFALDQKFQLLVWHILLLLVLIYVIMMGITGLILKKDHLDLCWKMKIKVLFFNPIYLVSYVSCAIKAIVVKNVSWVVIEHTRKQ